MNDSDAKLAASGGALADILLPAPNIDLSSWATIACDQYTQDRSYWERVKRSVGTAPSTLKLVLPEIYLEDGDRAERKTAIRAAMAAYYSGGIFAPPFHGAVYLERDTPYRLGRRGLVMAIDLEAYDWTPGAKPLIRATEGTVASRLPPRMEIRRAAPLETPHVLLLIDDDERRLIEGIGARVRKNGPLYRAELMEGSGTVTGWNVESTLLTEYIADELTRLRERSLSRYGADEPPFLFAVGDGNHSLATAKAVWDEYKAVHAGENGLESHPARWALVEVENLYDEAIAFEPIHRAVFGVAPEMAAAALRKLSGYTETAVDSAERLAALVAEKGARRTRYGLVTKGWNRLIETDEAGVATKALQPLLDDFVAADGRYSIDYLHGSQETIRVGRQADAVGILLPPVGKSDLFATVAKSGALPRKSFSMGEAPEKRFYLECRALFG